MAFPKSPWNALQRTRKFRATFLVNEILLSCDCHLCRTIKMVEKRADAHFVQFIVIPYGI